MKFLLTVVALFTLAACAAGEFTPERHALYESPVDCEKTPHRCIQGYPW